MFYSYKTAGKQRVNVAHNRVIFPRSKTVEITSNHVCTTNRNFSKLKLTRNVVPFRCTNLHIFIANDKTRPSFHARLNVASIWAIQLESYFFIREITPKAYIFAISSGDFKVPLYSFKRAETEQRFLLSVTYVECVVIFVIEISTILRLFSALRSRGFHTLPNLETWQFEF